MLPNLGTGRRLICPKRAMWKQASTNWRPSVPSAGAEGVSVRSEAALSLHRWRVLPGWEPAEAPRSSARSEWRADRSVPLLRAPARGLGSCACIWQHTVAYACMTGIMCMRVHMGAYSFHVSFCAWIAEATSSGDQRNDGLPDE